MSATDLPRRQAEEAADWLEDHRDPLEVHDTEMLYEVCGFLWRTMGRVHTRWARARPRGEHLGQTLETTTCIFRDLVDRLRTLADDLPLDEHDTGLDLVDLMEARAYCERTILPAVRGEFDPPEERLSLDRHRRSLEEADRGNTIPLGALRGG